MTSNCNKCHKHHVYVSILAKKQRKKLKMATKALRLFVQETLAPFFDAFFVSADAHPRHAPGHASI